MSGLWAEAADLLGHAALLSAQPLIARSSGDQEPGGDKNGSGKLCIWVFRVAQSFGGWL